MRHIVLDTETTGLSPKAGHRIIEIGCVELYNYIPTGRVFHKYLNPERDVPAEAFAVHGISAEFLRDKPLIKEIADDFFAFLGEDYKLVIHNAAFDMGFINYEFGQLGYQDIGNEYVIDTLAIARAQFPGAKNNLDALCSRFKVDNSSRDYHGALLDAEILARVYVHLTGGVQAGFKFKQLTESKPANLEEVTVKDRNYRVIQPKDDELTIHKEFMSDIKEAMWGNYK